MVTFLANVTTFLFQIVNFLRLLAIIHGLLKEKLAHSIRNPSLCSTIIKGYLFDLLIELLRNVIQKHRSFALEKKSSKCDHIDTAHYQVQSAQICLGLFKFGLSGSVLVVQANSCKRNNLASTVCPFRMHFFFIFNTKRGFPMPL